MSIEVSTSAGPTIVRPSEMSVYERWKTEIEYAEKELTVFHRRAEMVVRRFVDERDAMDSGKRWFNIFYANTNILESAIYAQLPKPAVARKQIDYQDDVARVAAIIMQRNIAPDVDDPRDNFDAVMRHAVQDRLVPGLAMAWCRLETDTEEEEISLASEPGESYKTPNIEFNGFLTGSTPDVQPDVAQPQPGGMPQAEGMVPEQMEPTAEEAAEKYERITDQRVCVDYIFWKDFLWSPCRVYEERRWTGRRAYLTRDELTKRFGEDKGGKVPLNFRPQGLSGSSLSSEPRNEAIEKAVIYEIWDRMDRKVIWLCKDWPELLDEKDDFLNLIGFEPHPKPMFANIGTSNTTPRPDYYMIQDQYMELDQVNNRISLLVKACKVVGVYSKSAQGVQRMLQEGFDNTLVPVDDWGMFAEKGGIKGQVDWLPLEQVVLALQRLYEARDAIKGQIYELTGIADIVRGASKASETLGAQQIKAQFASVRIKKLQDEVARFGSEILRIKAEIQVKHFDPEILLAKSNILHTDDANLAEPAMQLLMSEEGFEWRITISSDAMGQTDYAMEKAERTELLSVIAGFVQKGQPMLENPKWSPLMVNLLKWTISGFKGSEELEGMLDKQLDQIARTPPAPPPPNPDMIKAQAAQQLNQQKMQMAQQSHQMDMQGKQMDLQVQQAEGQQKLQQAQAEASIDIGGKQVEQAFKDHAYRMDRASESAALIHELRKNKLAEETTLRKSNLEYRVAERAAEQAARHANQQAKTRAARRPAK